MMVIKSICIITGDYPTQKRPRYPFVQQLAYALSNEGVDCYVIAPQSIPQILFRGYDLQPFYSEDINPEGKTIKVYRPFFMSFGNTNSLKLLKTAEYSFELAIKKAFKKIGGISCIYCYFWHNAISTINAFKNTSFSSIPVFVQASEGEISPQFFLMNKELHKRVRGVICASSKNLEESIEAGLTDGHNATIIPNGYRKDEFYPGDKLLARKKLNVAADSFIIVFVGSFIERKGISQLCEALNRFNDVYSIFIGQGPLTPNCKNILFAGKAKHNELIKYLHCADLFVLPTRAEGCCNAIVEAVASGLPVISSNKKFNDEILNEDCSIKINEQSVDELYNAIKIVKDNEQLRLKMSNASIEKSKDLSIEIRAKRILNFISLNISDV